MFVALKGGLAATKFLPSGTTAKELCKILPQKNISKIQVAGLTRASYRDESEVPNFEPFPYHKELYGWKRMLWSDIFVGCRVHKHTKLIVIDGPVACGKEKFAQKLAEEMDFLFLPQPTFDDLFVTHWGFDARTLDAKLPEGAKTWDIERFCQDPLNQKNASMQMYMLYLREKLWIQALTHILCTGQGVVTVRSPWSDTVFHKAMFKARYFSKKVFNALTDCCTESFPNMLHPHLVIYLDVPVDKTMENIKKNGKPFEKCATAFNENYLSNIELAYKREYLPYMNTFSLILCYDWSTGGDFELILEDIENLDFESYSEHETILSDWRFERGNHRYYTKLYSSHAEELLRNLDLVRFDVPEILVSGADSKVWIEEWDKVPDSQYAKGYNILKGEKDILFKTDSYIYKDNVTPLIEKYNERLKREKAGKKGKAADH